MWVVRWTNLIFGVLLSIGTLGFFILGAGSPPALRREPCQVWLGEFWVWLSQSWAGLVWGLLAALCFANARLENGTDRFNWRTLANLAAVLFLVLMLFRDRSDTTERLILVLLALGPLITLVGAWRHSRVKRRNS